MKFIMSNKTYDFLCWLVKLVLPAVGTLYFGLSEIWGFPYATEILGTISVITTFLAVVLGISDANYEPSDNE